MKVPGFVDLQVNGYMGIDFSSSELTEESCYFAFKKILETGTIIFMPTVITSSMEVYRKNLGVMARVIERDDVRTHVPGIHLEGPFLSEVDGARGAHDADWIRKPDIASFEDFYEWSGRNIKLLTIAAELEGAAELCKYVTQLGITVSLGHQMAAEADLERLVKAGARSLTHLGNGLPMYIHRHDNPIWAGLANDQLTAMIISDGHHINPSVLKTIIRNKGISKTYITSDASPIAGMPPGKYHTLGNNALLENSGRLFNPDSGYLVGSSSMLIDCVNYLISLDFLSNSEIFQMSFHNPLRLIDMDPDEILKQFQPHLEMNSGEVIVAKP